MTLNTTWAGSAYEIVPSTFWTLDSAVRGALVD